MRTYSYTEAARMLRINKTQLTKIVKDHYPRDRVYVVSAKGGSTWELKPTTVDAINDELGRIEDIAGYTVFYDSNSYNEAVRMHYPGGTMVIDLYNFFNSPSAHSRVTRLIKKVIPQLDSSSGQVPYRMANYLSVSQAAIQDEIVAIEAAQKKSINYAADKGITTPYGSLAAKNFEKLKKKKEQLQKKKASFERWEKMFMEVQG